MSYPPKHHQDNDKNHIIEVIKAYPLATLISVKNNKPFISHLPLILNNDKLIGHIDKNNPQAELLANNSTITVIFSGPQCYISPSIYEGDSQLPTWNYIKVHIEGKVIAINDKNALKQSLIGMTQFLESPEHKYVLEADNPKMALYLDYIAMFEIEITGWEGKFKLSQDKQKTNFIAAKNMLIESTKKNIEEFLKKLL